MIFELGHLIPACGGSGTSRPDLKSQICQHHTPTDLIDEEWEDIKKLPGFMEYGKNACPIFFIDKISAGTQLFAATQLSGFSKNPEFSVPWKVRFLGT